jgi:integrase
LLTNRKLESLVPADVGKRLTDSLSLFGTVRANVDGTVSVPFTYRYRFGGKLRDLRCGTWPEKALKEIRQERDLAKALLSERKDPGLVRRMAKLESAKEQQRLQSGISADAERLTINKLFDLWRHQELSGRRNGDAEVTRSFKKDILPVIGPRAAETIRRGDIAALLDVVVHRGAPIVANHLLGDLKQMFGFAITRNYLEADPTSHLKKADFGGKAKERDRVLSNTEVQELSIKIPDARLAKSTEHAIWTMLSTCCRVGELSMARWNDIDVVAGIWLIPAANSKNARAHTVYLSTFAKRHFKALHDLKTQHEWVFPNDKGDSHVSVKSITKQLNDRHRTVPMTNRSKATGTLLLSGGKWTPHDLRRTGATIMGDLGIRPDVIERCLNHVEPNRVRRIYQRQKLATEQKKAWTALGKKLSMLTKMPKAKTGSSGNQRGNR